MTNGVYDREKAGEQSYQHPDVGPGHDRAAGDASDPRGGGSSPSDDQLRDMTGIRAGEEAAMDQGARDHAAGGGFYNAKGDNSAESPKAINDREAAAGSDAGDNEGGLYNPTSKRTRKLGKFWTTRRTAAAGGIIGVSGAVVIGGLSIVQGPMQFTHFAQLLEKFHFSRNEDFSDNRSSKLMLYAMVGRAERGRLTNAGNVYADRWEKRMFKETGMRPLYRSSNGRLVGYEIDAKNPKALNDALAKNPELKAAFDQAQKSGAKILTRGQALERGNLRGTKNRGGSSPVIGKDNLVIDFRDVNERGFRETRVFTKSVAATINRPKLAGAIGSRVLIKRGGVQFGFFNNSKKKIDNKADANTRKKQAEDYEKNMLKRWATVVKAGVSRDKRTQTDKDGQNNDDTTAEGQAASDEVNKAANEIAQAGEAGGDTTEVTNKLVKGAAGGSALAVGVFCAVKDTGDQVNDYKQTNVVKPMMRMGTGVMGMGGGAQAGSPYLNLDEMGVMSTRLHDDETGKSWTDAASIRAEMGMSGGEPVPEAARLGKVGDKGDVFEIVDAVAKYTPLGTACAVINGASNLPIIRDVSNLASSITSGGMNIALKPFDTSVEEITEAGLRSISGEAVNAYAKGAEFGNLVNIGAFLAGIAQAIATGGTSLSNEELGQLNAEQNIIDSQNNSQKSYFARYLDPSNYASLTGRLIDSSPTSTTQVASLFNPLKSLGSSFSAFAPKVKAAGQKYDYGVKTYGFSLADQNDDRFEDPYENAAVVEPQLAELNDKYGKCFGATIGEDGSYQNGELVNVFKLEKDPEYAACRDDKNQEMFKRYRFYIADTLTLKSLNCYEGDNEACSEIGTGTATATASPTEDDSTTITGSAQELAKKILNSSNATLQPNPLSSMRAASQGEKSPAGIDKCGTQHPPVALDIKLLGFLAELAEEDNYTITSLTTGAHACTSNHYKGVAADFGCDIDTVKADRIGKKYGIKHNFESCADAIPHWHYSIGGG